MTEKSKKAPRRYPPTCEDTGDDFAGTLNGFDEIAIAKHFGEDVDQLRSKPFAFMRALAFVHQRRQGQKDGDAFKAAMQLTWAALSDYFADDEPDPIDPDDPDGESGKEPSLDG